MTLVKLQVVHPSNPSFLKMENIKLSALVAIQKTVFIVTKESELLNQKKQRIES